MFFERRTGASSIMFTQYDKFEQFLELSILREGIKDKGADISS